MASLSISALWDHVIAHEQDDSGRRPISDFGLYMALLPLTGEDGVIPAGLNEIVRQLGISKPALVGGLKRLVHLDLAEYSAVPSRASLVRLVLP